MHKFSFIFAAFSLFLVQNLSAQTTVQGSIQTTGTPVGLLVVAKPSVTLTNVRFSNFSVTISLPHQAVTPTATIISNSLPHLNWTQITDLNNNGRDYFIFLGIIDVNNNATVTWGSTQDNPVLNIEFFNGVGSAIAQLNDLTAENGGNTLQAYWYVEQLGPGDITNYNEPFYASVGSSAATNNAGGDSFVATTSSVTLPVELIAFKAEKLDDKFVRLHWLTANETRFSHFEIERSPDGFSWKTIGSAASKSLQGERAEYYFNDDQPLVVQNFYRLRMLDKDGSADYSNIDIVNFNSSTSLSIFPNPTAGLVKLTWNTNEPETKRAIELFDSTGRLILTQTTENNTTTVDMSGIAAGAYWLRINTGRETSSYRLLRL